MCAHPRQTCAPILAGKDAQLRSKYFQESEVEWQLNGGEDGDGRSAVFGLSEEELEQIDDMNQGSHILVYSGFAWQLYRAH